MWIVRLALRRPYTFIVAALVVLLMGVLSLQSMSTDIFPTIDIPLSYESAAPIFCAGYTV